WLGAVCLLGCSLSYAAEEQFNDALNAANSGNTALLDQYAKVARDLSEQEKKWKTRGTQEYIELAQRCLNSMQEVQPLTSELDDR
ncbi:hypothetical protein RFX62_13965, partial [Acinetobacter baumannii]|nr:hypothetical protein [Acinetobacter baumannii]